MSQIFQILMNVSRDFLTKPSSATAVDESEFEFAEYIAESMVLLGSSNLQSVAGDAAIVSSYLQQVVIGLHCILLKYKWLNWINMIMEVRKYD